jgi:hypothetical protein
MTCVNEVQEHDPYKAVSEKVSTLNSQGAWTRARTKPGAYSDAPPSTTSLSSTRKGVKTRL